MKKHPQGFIAISTALILSTVFLSISLSMAMRAISGSEVSIALHNRETARYLSLGCLDYARMELQRTLNYAGNESILINDKVCEIHAVEGAGTANRILKVESTVGSHTVRIKDVIQHISPNMVLVSSERVVSF